MPTATDNCGVTITQIAGLRSGAIFPVGITTNTFEIKDPSGNSVTTSFTVDIRDRYLPFPLIDISLCANERQLVLNQGFDKITFLGLGMQSDKTTFNPIISGSGQFMINVSFIDSMDCITTDKFNIEVRQSPGMPSITRVASDKIITSIEYDKYQWYRNGTLLQGKNDQLYRVDRLGVYSVVVGNKENCFATSEGYGFGIPVNEEQISNQGSVRVFPNPTDGIIFVEINDDDELHTLIITDGLGAQLFVQETISKTVKIDISSFTVGSYYLNVTSTATNNTIKIIKN